MQHSPPEDQRQFMRRLSMLSSLQQETIKLERKQKLEARGAALLASSTNGVAPDVAEDRIAHGIAVPTTATAMTLATQHLDGGAGPRAPKSGPGVFCFADLGGTAPSCYNGAHFRVPGTRQRA